LKERPAAVTKGGRVGKIKYQALEEGLEKRKAWEEIFLTDLTTLDFSRG
jgi:hypothetical protein